MDYIYTSVYHTCRMCGGQFWLSGLDYYLMNRPVLDLDNI